MSSEIVNQMTFELKVLGPAIASFFASREHSDLAANLSEICERLVLKTATGTSHLVPEEYDDLCIDPLQFSAVGTPQDDLPLF